jgi:hypothetical protein
MAVGLAGLAKLQGNDRLAVGILIGFQALLRTGELLALRTGDFLFGQSRSQLQLRLGFTKSGKRRGEQEFVCVDDPAIVAYARQVIGTLPAGAKLLESGPVFRREFASLLEPLAISKQFAFKPYSLRRGGATFLFGECGSFSIVAARGRWANVPTARIYVDEAVAAQCEHRLGRQDERLLAKWAQAFE